MPTPAICPVCDEDVPPKAKACPNCGADERSGWREDALIYDGLDLPDEAWGDGPESSSSRPSHQPALIWRVAGALALLGMLWWIVGGVVSRLFRSLF